MYTRLFATVVILVLVALLAAPFVGQYRTQESAEAKRRQAEVEWMNNLARAYEAELDQRAAASTHPSVTTPTATQPVRK